MSDVVLLTSEDIRRGLAALDSMASDAGMTIDLSIYGGAAMVLTYHARTVTRDVDAVVRGDQDFLRKAVAEIATAEGWPLGWLNDGVKGFVSSAEQMEAMREFQGTPKGGLRVCVPSPQYLFAMKCMAMRSAAEDGHGDVADIETLAGLAGVSDAAEALAIVESFYPEHLILPKVRFGIEEIMQRLGRNDGTRTP